jgi:hypothetical protein
LKSVQGVPVAHLLSPAVTVARMDKTAHSMRSLLWAAVAAVRRLRINRRKSADREVVVQVGGRCPEPPGPTAKATVAETGTEGLAAVPVAVPVAQAETAAAVQAASDGLSPG